MKNKMMKRTITMLVVLCLALTAFTACAFADQSASGRYTITLVDEKGEPVNGCMINICSDKTCNPQRLTDTNTFSFDGIGGEQYAYVVHVLKVPDGYKFDTTQAFTLNAAGDSLTITVPHA